MNKLNSTSRNTVLTTELGIQTFEELLVFLKALPYGRNKNRKDLSLVLTEKQGTCSSKHGFAKLVADENNINCKLLCVMYNLNVQNTPKATTIYEKYRIKKTPEAHCILEFEEKLYDLTFPESNIEELIPDIIQRKEVSPSWLEKDKIQYHQSFMKEWLRHQSVNYTFDEVWKIREEMIQSL